MMLEKCAAVERWFSERLSECLRREQQLIRSARAGEALFVRIEHNVYQMFKNAFAETVRTCGDDENAVGEQFKQKLILLPAGWHTSVVQAVQNGDLEAAHVETRKLAAADEVKTAFYRIWEA